LNQTLCSFFEDSIIIHEQGEFKDVLIEIDFNINCLLKETKYLKFKYVSLDKENEYKKHIKTLKNRQYRMIYFLKYTFLSIDTIDITISSSNIYKGGEKGYEIAVSCRGTIGYIPQGRFIYDKKRDEWDFILGKTILNEKAEEIDEYYKKIIEDNRKRIDEEKTFQQIPP
jgi:hypothetical protein